MKRHSALTLFFYALPAVALAAFTLPFYVVVPTFYSASLGLPLAGVASVLFFIRILDAVCDPVIGYMCDRMKVPFGRRRFWFFISLPVSAFAAMRVFVPDGDVSLTYLAFWGAVLSLSYSITFLSYTAWGAELATSYSERSRVSAFREVAVVLGTVVATAMPALMAALGRADDAASLYAIALFCIGLLLVSAPIAGFIVPEPEDRSVQSVAFWKGLKALWENKPFLRLIVAYAFNGFANGLPATLFLFYVTDRLGAFELRGPLLLGYFVVGLLSVPLWLRLSERWGKHRAWCYAMIFACIAFSAAPLLPYGSVWPFGVVVVLTGACLGADLVIPSSMQADVIDVDTLNTGSQRSGLYFAAWSLVTQLSLACAVGFSFGLLSLAGFDADRSGSMTADADGVFLLGVLYGWAPIAAKLFAVVIVWGYPIDRERQEQIKAAIEGKC